MIDDKTKDFAEAIGRHMVRNGLWIVPEDTFKAVTEALLEARDHVSAPDASRRIESALQLAANLIDDLQARAKEIMGEEQ